MPKNLIQYLDQEIQDQHIKAKQLLTYADQAQVALEAAELAHKAGCAFIRLNELANLRALVVGGHFSQFER